MSSLAAGGEPRTIDAPIDGPAVTQTFVLPKGVTLDVEAVYIEVNAGGAGGPVTAELTISESSGVVIAKKRQSAPIDPGGPGSATWALRLGDEAAAAGGGAGVMHQWDAVLHATGGDPTGYTTLAAGKYTTIGKLFIGWLDLFFDDPAPTPGAGIYELEVPAGLGTFDGSAPGPLAEGRYAHAGGKSYIATLVPLGIHYSRWLIEYYDPVAVQDVLVTALPPWGGYVHFDSIFNGFVVARLG